MTTFCESVTARSEQKTRAPGGVDTNDVGEAMAPASEFHLSGGINLGAGAKPSCLIALAFVLGCSDDAKPPPPSTAPVAASRVAADPAAGITTELDTAAPRFGEGLIAELAGRDADARLAFDAVLAGSNVPAPVAARAALHLAQLEARTGKSGRARDLIARATSLAPTDLEISEGAAQVEIGLRGANDIRGPRVGTVLAGVDAKTAAAFRTAEAALEAVHRMHPRPFLFTLSSSVRAKEDATEDAVAKYRVVAEAGGLAKLAADYRIGSLYHDLALGLVFDLPPELDPSAAAVLRRTLSSRTIENLKKAVAAYRAAQSEGEVDGGEPWRRAASIDLRAALDVLSATNDGSQ